MILHTPWPIAAPNVPAADDNWARHGVCANPAYLGQAEDLWYAHAKEHDKLNEAIRLCHACPVRQRCLAEALREEGNIAKDRRFGIRGGLQPTQRRRLYDELQRRKKAA